MFLFETIILDKLISDYILYDINDLMKKAKNQGIAKILMEKMKELVVGNEREGITLTYKEELISFYEKLGFVDHGLSESKHGGVSWYNFVKRRKGIN